VSVISVKTAELIEMPFDGETHMSPQNNVLDGIQILYSMAASWKWQRKWSANGTL